MIMSKQSLYICLQNGQLCMLKLLRNHYKFKVIDLQEKIIFNLWLKQNLFPLADLKNEWSELINYYKRLKIKSFAICEFLSNNSSFLKCCAEIFFITFEITLFELSSSVLSDFVEFYFISVFKVDFAESIYNPTFKCPQQCLFGKRFIIEI